MTAEERLGRIERIVERTSLQIADNSQNIAELRLSIAQQQKNLVRLEVKVDQLASVIAHLVGKDPLDFGKPRLEGLDTSDEK